MELHEIEQLLKGNDNDAKIEVVSHLSDVFESYNKDIANFKELVDLLLRFAVVEKNVEVQEELFDTLLNSATYQDTENINWDMIEQHLNQLPSECMRTAINILGLSHNKKYVSTLSEYCKHENKVIRAEAIVALIEMEQGQR